MRLPPLDTEAICINLKVMDERLRDALIGFSFDGLVKTGFVGVVIFSIAGYLGGVHRWLELTSHFKVQYAALSLCCVIFFCIRRRWRWSAASLLCVALNFAVILPFYLPRSGEHGEVATNEKLKLLLSNVNTANTNYAAVLELVRTENPDIVIVQEVDDRWLSNIAGLRISHPYTDAATQRDNFGIAIFSRFPLKETRIVYLNGLSVPSIEAKADIAGREIYVLTMHPPPPVNDTAFSSRNEHFARAASYIKQQSTPAILIGDHGETLRSPYFQKLMRDGDLVDVRRGFGILPSWSTSNRLMMIPIDHCLTTPDIGVLGVRTGADVGSDHLPLIVELAVR